MWVMPSVETLRYFRLSLRDNARIGLPKSKWHWTSCPHPDAIMNCWPVSHRWIGGLFSFALWAGTVRACFPGSRRYCPVKAGGVVRDRVIAEIDRRDVA